MNDGPGAIDLSITGVIQDDFVGPTGAGVIKEGAGTLELLGPGDNTYTGTTRVNERRPLAERRGVSRDSG